MQDSNLIERQWPGFGDCRITIAPVLNSAPSSLTRGIFAGVLRALNSKGLGSLSFTIDPAWILEEGESGAGPLVSRFLRRHGRSLAEEWEARQRADLATPRATPQATARVMLEAEGVPESRPEAAGHRIQGPAVQRPAALRRPPDQKGLPIWFELCCGARRISE